MELQKGYIIAIGVTIVAAVALGASVIFFSGSNDVETPQDNNDVSNEFSLKISNSSTENKITEDTYNFSFTLESVYTFEINCDYEDDGEKEYNFDIKYYSGNTIKVKTNEDEVSLNELININDSIKSLFDVVEDNNKFSISFYDNIRELVKTNLSLSDESEISYQYKADQLHFEFSCNNRTINLYGYLSEAWSYYFEVTQIIF